MPANRFRTACIGITQYRANIAEPLPTNGLRSTVDSGGVALRVLDNAYSPTLVEFYSGLGVDFVWLDFGMAEVNEKAESGYQILSVGSTAGAIQSTVRG